MYDSKGMDSKGLDGPLAGLDEFDELLSLETQWEKVIPEIR